MRWSYACETVEDVEDKEEIQVNDHAHLSAKIGNVDQ